LRLTLPGQRSSAAGGSVPAALFGKLLDVRSRALAVAALAPCEDAAHDRETVLYP